MNMNSFTLYGLLMFAGSGLSLLFQSISTLMEKPEWSTIVLGDMSYDIWVAISDKLPTGTIQNGFDYVVFELSLWILLLTLGIMCVIAGKFIKE